MYYYCLEDPYLHKELNKLEEDGASFKKCFDAAVVAEQKRKSLQEIGKGAAGLDPYSGISVSRVDASGKSSNSNNQSGGSSQSYNQSGSSQPYNQSGGNSQAHNQSVSLQQLAEDQGGLVTTNNYRVKVVMVPVTVEHGGMVARRTSSVTNAKDLVTILESAQMGPVSRQWRWTMMTVIKRTASDG